MLLAFGVCLLQLRTQPFDRGVLFDRHFFQHPADTAQLALERGRALGILFQPRLNRPQLLRSVCERFADVPIGFGQLGRTALALLQPLRLFDFLLDDRLTLLDLHALRRQLFLRGVQLRAFAFQLLLRGVQLFARTFQLLLRGSKLFRMAHQLTARDFPLRLELILVLQQPMQLVVEVMKLLRQLFVLVAQRFTGGRFHGLLDDVRHGTLVQFPRQPLHIPLQLGTLLAANFFSFSSSSSFFCSTCSRCVRVASSSSWCDSSVRYSSISCAFSVSIVSCLCCSSSSLVEQVRACSSSRCNSATVTVSWRFSFWASSSRCWNCSSSADLASTSASMSLRNSAISSFLLMSSTFSSSGSSSEHLSSAATCSSCFSRATCSCSSPTSLAFASRHFVVSDSFVSSVLIVAASTVSSARSTIGIRCVTAIRVYSSSSCLPIVTTGFTVVASFFAICIFFCLSLHLPDCWYSFALNAASPASTGSPSPSPAGRTPTVPRMVCFSSSIVRRRRSSSVLAVASSSLYVRSCSFASFSLSSSHTYARFSIEIASNFSSTSRRSSVNSSTLSISSLLSSISFSRLSFRSSRVSVSSTVGAGSTTTVSSGCFSVPSISCFSRSVRFSNISIDSAELTFSRLSLSMRLTSSAFSSAYRCSCRCSSARSAFQPCCTRASSLLSARHCSSFSSSSIDSIWLAMRPFSPPSVTVTCSLSVCSSCRVRHRSSLRSFFCSSSSCIAVAWFWHVRSSISMRFCSSAACGVTLVCGSAPPAPSAARSAVSAPSSSVSRATCSCTFDVCLKLVPEIDHLLLDLTLARLTFGHLQPILFDLLAQQRTFLHAG
uniref:Uncharacterized protein n=1 Tax=Anopheles farauti TaxID=69004 RepID=A0A182QHE5_9DIPT